MRQFLFFLVVLTIALMPLQAASFNASNLLTQAYADQLQAWLGEGPIILTRIFSKVTGDGLTATNFHASADNKGRTITLMKVSNYSNQIIGGYNANSWDTTTGWRFASNTSEFLFNLTNTTKFQKNNTNWTHTTYNNIDRGPSFGPGHDLYVDATLQSGYVYGNYSYGTGNGSATNPLLSGYSTGAGTTYSGLEVFTITNGVIPEPCSILLMGFSLVMIRFFLKK